jgi:putative membrane protein
MYLLSRLLISTLIVFLASELVPGFDVNSIYVALVVAVVLGIINVTIKPILFVLTLPITIMSLGLFTFVLNALMILLVGNIVKGVTITGFWPALLTALFISLAHMIVRRFEQQDRANQHLA